mmetsp:Transcript_1053/g.1112  ORF Transcript_1053/g.1112 Transcript_1053/m.1112 type:complete len:108 (+) Transcript_1053:2-325(+)
MDRMVYIRTADDIAIAHCLLSAAHLRHGLKLAEEFPIGKEFSVNARIRPTMIDQTTSEYRKQVPLADARGPFQNKFCPPCFEYLRRISILSNVSGNLSIPPKANVRR